MKKPAVAIQLDALRHNYITDNGSSFLFSLKKEGISSSLLPTFGFEPDAAYFAGLYPEQCDGGMLYWYSPETSPFNFTKYLPAWFDRLPDILQLGLRRLIRLYAQRKSNYPRIRAHVPTVRIPFKYLRYFDFPMKYFPFHRRFANGQTIFNLLRERGMTWFFHGSPLHDVRAESVLRRVKAELNSPVDFAFLHIGDLDSVGHKFGPDSEELKKALSEVDKCIEEIYDYLCERFGRINLVIFGDHGMVQVEKIVDIEAKLKELKVKPGRDYVYFLDSTLARFWFKNKRAREEITDMLSDIEDGRILNHEDIARYRINYGHNKFGELMFWVNGGVLIFPNFFNHKTPDKGMHGYLEEVTDNHSAFILHSPEDKHNRLILDNPMNITVVFSILLKLIGLDNKIR